MNGRAHFLLSLAVVGALLPLSTASAQIAERPAPPDAVPASLEPNPLPGLPEPPDVPRSLFVPPIEPEHGPHLPGPYCEYDPRLDTPLLPQPGWFAAVELDIVGPHVINKLSNTVSLAGFPVDVHGLTGELDWTVGPHLEIGYRLPSGLGEFVLGYRYLGSSGSKNVSALDGSADLKSKLDLHALDLDYASREWSLWDCCWDMKWRFGLRATSIYFDSNVAEPVKAAAAGAGIVAEDVSNRFVGGGPHVGLELDRKFADWGLAMFVRSDVWFGLGRIRQVLSAQGAPLVPGGALPFGETVESRSQTGVQALIQAGVRWEPGWHHTQVFAGYQYEYWWYVGHDSDMPNSRGDVYDQGLFLKAEFNY